MNYNNFFPHYPQTNNTINWVQGEAAAKSYLVAPGGSTILMDSERPMFYIKSVDQSGMPSLRKFRFEEITEQQAVNPDQFITRDEFEAKIAELRGESE